MSSPNLDLHEAALLAGAAYTVNDTTKQICYIVDETVLNKLVSIIVKQKFRKLPLITYTNILNGKSVQTLGHIGYAEHVLKELKND